MSNEVIYLSNVRLSFPHLVEPQERRNLETGEVIGRFYNCDLIMSKDHKGFAEFHQRFAELAQGEWKELASAKMQQIDRDSTKRCYGDGNTRLNSKTMQVYSGYEGNVYITASSANAPDVYDDQANKTRLEDNAMQYKALAGRMYAGCRVNVAVKPWLQKKLNGGIRCDLLSIQFAGDDEPFGEGANVDTSNLFGAVQVAQSQPSVAPLAQPIQQPANTGMPGLPPFLS